MRSRIVVLAMLLVFAVAAGAQAEGAGIMAKGMKVGVNIAGHHGSDTDDHHKSRTAFVGGGFLTYALTPALAIQPEVLYSQKGYKWDDGDYKETGKYNYIEIPIILKYMFQLQGSTTPGLYAGLAPAFLMSAKVEVEHNETGMGVILRDSATLDVKKETKGTDFGLVFGGGVDFATGPGLLTFDVRYTMGMTKVDDSEHKWDEKNKAITIMVGFGIN